MLKIRHLCLAAILVGAMLAPLRGEAAPCEGRCDDGNGAVMTVEAGNCDEATEVCQAGCDTTVPGKARAYAECRSRASGRVAKRRVAPPTGNERERDGAGAAVTETE